MTNPILAYAPNWKLLISGALLGALAGFGSYYLAFGGTEAVAIVQAARVGGMESIETRVTPQLVIDRRSSPQLLIDSLQTLPFAEKVADAVSEPTLALDLAARQFGGKGQLRARAISDGTLIEIRVRAANADAALKIVKAASELAVQSDDAVMAPLKTLAKQRLDRLEGQYNAALKLANLLGAAVSKIQDSGGDSQTNSIVLSAAASAQDRLSSAEQALWALQTGLSTPMSQDSGIFAPPAIVRPIISSPVISALVGMFGGLALVVAFWLLRQFGQVKKT